MIDWSKPLEWDDDGTWRPARLLGEIDNPKYPMVLAARQASGTEIEGSYSRNSDFIRNVAPPKVTRRGYLNLYPDGSGEFYTTRTEADRAPDSNRYECREITWEVEDAR